MDSFCALALQMEASDKELLKGSPLTKNERIPTPSMVRNVLMWSLYQIVVCVLIIYACKPLYNIDYNRHDPFYWNEDDVAASALPDHVGPVRELGPTDKLEMYTVLFNTVIFMNVFNLFNARILNQTTVINTVGDAWRN